MNMPVSGFQPSQIPLFSPTPFPQPEGKNAASEALQNKGVISYGPTQPATPFTAPDSQNQLVNPGSQNDPLQILQQISQTIESLLSSLFQKLGIGNNQSSGQDKSSASGDGNTPSPSQSGNSAIPYGGQPTPEGNQPSPEGNQPSPGGNQPAPQTTPANPTPVPANGQSGNDSANKPDTGNSPVNKGGVSTESVGDSNPNIDPNKNSITFENKGKEAYTMSFTPNADVNAPAIPDVTVKPGETKTVQLPEGWAGNTRSNKGDGQNITLGEVKFNGGVNKDQTFYDVSYIEGFDVNMRMQPVQGGRVSGTLDDLLSDAPDSIKARDANGNVTGLKKTTNAETIDQSIVDYYRTKVDNAEGYVVPLDNDSTLGTNSKNIKIELM